MLDFGFDDNYVIQSLTISMQELHRMKLGLPPAPRPGDAVEKPTKPFGSFEPPSVEQLIASMQVEATNGAFIGRPSIPADGGPVAVPEALLKRQASDWSFLERDNNEDVVSLHASVAASNCPSSRTSLVSDLLDNIGSLSTSNEPGIVSFVVADGAFSSRTTLTDRSQNVDQISNSEYDNIPVNNRDEFSNVYEQELEQTLESIEQEIQELIGMPRANSDKHNDSVSAAVIRNDQLYSQPVTVSSSITGMQQNHVVDTCVCRSSQTSEVDSVFTSNFSTPELHSDTGPSPLTAIAGSTHLAPVTLWSNSYSSQTPNDVVVIPIQHLPSSTQYHPPIKPKPKNTATSPPSSSVLTPIPVLHLRTVPIAQFSSISTLSATNRPVPTSSTNGC